MTSVGTYEYNPPFFCEACQNHFGTGQQVELEDGTAMPVCGLCWNQIPVAQRIKLASDFKHQAAMRDMIANACGWLRFLERLMDKANADERQADEADGMSDPWGEETGGTGPGMFGVN